LFSYLPLNERWNVYTHGLGALLSILGSFWLLTSTIFTSSTAFWGCLIYGLSMIFLFSSSAIYHSQKIDNQLFWQKIDHIGIYFLIAGSYTPVTLTILNDTSGPYLLVAVWSIALLGLIYKLYFIGRFQNLSLFLYLAMGWLVVFDIKNVYTLFPSTAFFYLVLGGAFYTLGTFFYRWEKLYFHHVIWHLFVLAGAFSHFMMVVNLVR